MGTAEFFKSYTEAYDRVMSRQGLSVYRKLLDLHLEALNGKNRILDSGCGPGNLAIELLEDSREVYAVDQNNAALNRLKTKASKASGKLHAYCGDVHTLPFGDSFLMECPLSLFFRLWKDRLTTLESMKECLAMAVYLLFLVQTLKQGTT